MDDKELIFETRALFREWLENAGTTSDGIWLVFAKTNTLKTLSAHEALEEALCFGWIDGQMQSINEDKYRKYFARRREKSNWSDKNKELVRKLIQKGLMTPKGMEAVACAKQNGQWDNSKRRPAYTNLLAMSDSVQRTYTLFYLDAKSDKTRQTRMEKIIDRLNKNLKPM